MPLRINKTLLHSTVLFYSHNVAAPMSPRKQEVSCYIDHNVTMAAQTKWRLEIENRESDDDLWFPRLSEVKLIHADSESALSLTSQQLPDWGVGQYEIVADRFTFHENTLWRADDATPPVMPHANHSFSSQSSLTRIINAHKTLFLKTFEYSDEHPFATSPLDWPMGFSNLIYWLEDSSNVSTLAWFCLISEIFTVMIKLPNYRFILTGYGFAWSTTMCHLIVRLVSASN